MTQGLSRRGFLKGTTILAGASALSFNSLFGFSRAFAQAATGTDDDLQTVINLAATAELFASTHYLAAINAANAGDLDLDEVQVNYLKTAFLAEREHYDLLLSLGAQPVVTEFYVPPTLFSDKALFAQITEVAETAFTAAYLAAARIFTNLGQPAFAVTAAQIAAVEAEHRALVRQIGGLLPNNGSYERFNFNNVSDAVPVLQPFLDGSGEGFVGPVAPPSDADVAAIRAEADMLGYMATMPYAAMATAPMAEATDMSMGGSIMALAGSANVNIRREPTTSAQVDGVLNSGQSAPVDGQRMGDDGMMWWHLSMGGWVRSDAVTVTDGAADLPQM